MRTVDEAHVNTTLECVEPVEVADSQGKRVGAWSWFRPPWSGTALRLLWVHGLFTFTKVEEAIEGRQQHGVSIRVESGPDCLLPGRGKTHGGQRGIQGGRESGPCADLERSRHRARHLLLSLESHHKLFTTFARVRTEAQEGEKVFVRSFFRARGQTVLGVAVCSSSSSLRRRQL